MTLLSLTLFSLAVVAALVAYNALLQHRLDIADHGTTTDPLTGLSNREGLGRHFARLLAAADERQLVAALVIDGDHFKDVNDTFGRSIGDDVLRSVGHRLQICRIGGRQPCAARLGDDEFALVLPLSAEDHFTGTTLQALASLVARPVVACSVQARLSAGFATTTPAATAEQGGLLGQADAAMYRAKRSGSGLQPYRAGLDDHLRQRGRPTLRFRDCDTG